MWYLHSWQQVLYSCLVKSPPKVVDFLAVIIFIPFFWTVFKLSFTFLYHVYCRCMFLYFDTQFHLPKLLLHWGQLWWWLYWSCPQSCSRLPQGHQSLPRLCPVTILTATVSNILKLSPWSPVISKSNEIFDVLNYIALYTKVYIYKCRLFENSDVDLFSLLCQIKGKMKTEKKTCEMYHKFKTVYDIL